MTKQEKIMEGLDELFHDMGLGETMDSETFINTILAYLHSQGVMIKVDRKFRSTRAKVSSSYNDYMLGVEDILDAGYVAVEPLIKGREII